MAKEDLKKLEDFLIEYLKICLKKGCYEKTGIVYNSLVIVQEDIDEILKEEKIWN